MKEKQSEEMQQVLNAVTGLSYEIARVNQMTYENVSAAICQAQMQNRKPRRKKVGVYITFSQQGLNLVQRFDDGTENFLILSSEVFGTPQIYKLRFWGMKIPGKYFLVFFKESSIYIIGNCEKLSPKYLYDCFLLSGIRFSLQIPKKEVADALYEELAPGIISCVSEMQLCALQGWYRKKFNSYSHDGIICEECLPLLPLQKKTFPSVILDKEKINQYFCKLRKISDMRARVTIALYPFAGILNSILQKQEINCSFYINFIVDDMALKKKICWFLQIFSRENLEPISLDISDKQLKTLLEEMNDEVLITDSCLPGQSKYTQSKIGRNLEWVGNICSGRTIWSGERKLLLCAVLANISFDYVYGSNVLNIFLRQAEWQNITMNPEIMEAVFCSFVSYVERHYDQVIQKIETEKRNFGCEMFPIVLKLVEGFWQEIKLDFCTELDVPRNFDVTNMLEEEQREEDFADISIKLIREAIKDQGIVSKQKAKSCDNMVYNDHYLWISTIFFKELLQSQNMARYEARFLAEMKGEEILITDKEGYSRKLQIDGNRREFYQFSRERLSPAGLVDIVELGGKVDE